MTNNLKPERIVRRALRVPRSFDQNSAMQQLVSEHPKVSEQNLIKVMQFRFGNFVLFIATYGKKSDLQFKRYIVKMKIRDQTGRVVEFCDVDNEQPSKVVQQVNSNGETVTETTNVAELIETNKVVSQVVTLCEHAKPKEVPSAKDITKIKTTETTLTTEVVLTVEKAPEEPKKEILVVHDKPKNTDTIISTTTVVEKTTTTTTEEEDEEESEPEVTVVTEKTMPVNIKPVISTVTIKLGTDFHCWK